MLFNGLAQVSIYWGAVGVNLNLAVGINLNRLLCELT